MKIELLLFSRSFENLSGDRFPPILQVYQLRSPYFADYIDHNNHKTKLECNCRPIRSILVIQNPLNMAKNIDKLIQEADQTLRRIESIQSQQAKLTLSDKIAHHVRRHSGVLSTVVLTGALLAVSIARLSQKHDFEFAKEKLEEERISLESDNAQLRQRLQLVEEELNRAALWGWGWKGRIKPLVDLSRPMDRVIKQRSNIGDAVAPSHINGGAGSSRSRELMI